ncbi:MAG: hypothetical protein M8357_01760 [Desulfobulbaceae bacterium]|nr:hypothetical protein [Desulfobulbaceae bacterium]
MVRKELLHVCSGLMVLGILFLFCSSLSFAAIENSTEPSPAEETKADDAEWEYVFEDRQDPFMPFIEPEVATKSIPEEDEVILTGMQLFEPGQLKLVGIMFSAKKKYAMVEDVTGKGYILNEGMPVGRYGVVSQIRNDQVNITETRTVAGKEIVTPVIMRLNKEGDR